MKLTSEHVQELMQSYQIYDALWRPQLRVLPNGFKMVYPHMLDGGGDNYKQGLLEAIKKYGSKTTYQRSYEWCAGHGVINFYLYDQGVCETLAFSDIFFASPDSVILSAELNGIKDKVTAYLAHTVGMIPTTEKFDLVVSNPPHCPEHSLRDVGMSPDTDPFYSNAMRLVVDENWNIHRDFFQNISQRLAPGADVFLWEVNSFEEFIGMAESNGLTYIGTYDPKYEKDPNNRILHFRK